MIKIFDSLLEREKNKQKSDRTFLIVVLSIALFVLLMLSLFTFVFFNVWVEGDSMKNTLHDQDILVACYVKEPQKGDIVIINGMVKENGKSIDIIKRVIATEGDIVKIENLAVYVSSNGEGFVKLDEPYAKGVTIAYGEKQEWTVGKGEYFFLGDNRENSYDSRMLGVCKREQIVGVVLESSLALRGVSKGFYDLVFGIGRIFGVTA